jgi:MFS family permease
MQPVPPPEKPDATTLPPGGAPDREAAFTVGTLAYTKRAVLRVCAWILVADTGLAFRARALGPMIQLLLKGLGASNQVIAWTTVTLPQGLSLIFNPIVAHHSDRYRSRWGRRLPFIFITVPILTLTTAAMGFTPILGGYLHRALGDWSPGESVSGLIAFMVVFIVFELAAIVQSRTWGGLINDVLPQKVLGRFLAASRIISLLAGIIFNQFFLAHIAKYQLPAFITLSVLYGSTMIVLALFVREGGYPPPPPRAPRRGLMHAVYAVGGFIKECYGDPYYRWVMVMLCIDDIAFGAVNTFSLLHAKSLNMDLQTYGTCVAVQYVVGVIVAYPLGILADRYHPFRVSAVVLLLYGVAAAWSGFYIHDTTTFVIGFMAHGVFATSYNTSAAAMGYRLLARSRFTVLSAGTAIVGTLITMIVTPLLGLLLDQLHDQYRYSYLVGAGYVLLGVPLYIIVYRKFLARGGLANYVAPGEIT